MGCSATYVSYRDTGYFPDLVLDYIDGAESVKPYYHLPPNPAGIAENIRLRKENPTNREQLVKHLLRQYEKVERAELSEKQILSLKDPNTFTVTTAHQPNLFTGPLYLIYKIIHAIRLSRELKQEFPDHHFVPVYYMGNEDADFDELSHCRVMGERYTWSTDQRGAFGKLKVDDALLSIITQLNSLLPVYPHGAEIIKLLKNSYTKERSIEEATFDLLHRLFADYGLIILIADSKELKSQFVSVVKDELQNSISQKIVSKTIESLESKYAVQTGVREINLFYLIDGKRERIERSEKDWIVLNTSLRFTEESLLNELEQYPERFSPNVILRPLYQELLLPNMAFVGGAGELSYWLELKELFQHYQIPFPVLILRQSLLLTKEQVEKKITQMGFEVKDFFKPTAQLLNEYVKKHSDLHIDLDDELQSLRDLYKQIEIKAAKADKSLMQHTDALRLQAEKKLVALSKKMLRAERRRFSDEQRRIQKIKDELFPGGSLQERIDSIWTFYAISGKSILDDILNYTDPFNLSSISIIFSNADS